MKTLCFLSLVLVSMWACAQQARDPYASVYYAGKYKVVLDYPDTVFRNAQVFKGIEELPTSRCRMVEDTVTHHRYVELESRVFLSSCANSLYISDEAARMDFVRVLYLANRWIYNGATTRYDSLRLGWDSAHYHYMLQEIWGKDLLVFQEASPLKIHYHNPLIIYYPHTISSPSRYTLACDSVFFCMPPYMRVRLLAAYPTLRKSYKKLERLGKLPADPEMEMCMVLHDLDAEIKDFRKHNRKYSLKKWSIYLQAYRI